MLEDLKLVRAGEAPVHARRDVSLEHIKDIEETAKTIDADPEPVGQPPIWKHPLVVGLLAWSAVSMLVIVIMLVLLLAKA